MDTLQEEIETGLNVVNSKATDTVSDQVIPAMDKLIDKITPAISTLSQKLETTAEHLWMVLVKQSYNEAAGHMVIVIFTFVVIYAIFQCTKLWQKGIEKKGWSSDGWVGIIIVRILLPIAGTLISTPNLIYMVQKLFNPEFYALQTIMRYIK